MTDNRTLKVAAKPSVQYKTDELREAFNVKAKEMEMPFAWKSDYNENGIIDTGPELGMSKESWKKYGSTSFNFSKALTADISKVLTGLEVDRKALMQEVLSVVKPVDTHTDLSKMLTPPYEKIARILMEIEPHAKHIYQLQTHPNFDQLRDAILASGDSDAIALLKKNDAPTCGFWGREDFLGEAAAKCGLLATFPNHAEGDAMWPEGMNGAILQEIKDNSVKDGNSGDDPFMSPFTSVYWKDKENGIIGWRSFAENPLFKKDVEAICAILSKAASAAEQINAKAGKEVIDVTLIAQLKLQAKSFLSREAYPYKESDAAWIQNKSPLQITIGPYEAYEDIGDGDPNREVKAAFQFILAISDEKKTKEVEKIMSEIGDHEKNLARIIGSDVYSARDIGKKENKAPFLWVATAAGDMAGSTPVPIAHNLPNLNREEIGFKIETFSNHYEAKKAIMEEIGKIVLVPEQQHLVDYGSFIDNGHYHELTHACGPQGDSKVKGKDITVDIALGERALDLEETKADTGGVLYSALRHGAGSEGFMKDSVTALTGLFRSARFGLDSHGKGGCIRLAYFVEHGAVNVTGGRFKINFDKAESASEKLMKDLGRMQATGDKAGADKFVAHYLEKGQKLLADAMIKINAAGIPKDPDITYHVK